MSATTSTPRTLAENARHWVDRNIIHPVNNPLTELDLLHEKMTTEAEIRGVNEGKADKPLKNNILYYEETVGRTFRSLYTQLTTAPFALMGQLDAFLDATKQTISKHPYYERCFNFAEDFNRKKKNLEDEIDQYKVKIRDIRDTFGLIQKIAHRPSGKTNGLGFFLAFPAIFFLLLILLGILDLPFSIANFEYLNFNRNETILVGCAVISCVTLLSHFGGLSIKRYAYSRGYKNLAILIVLLILGFLGFTSVSRYEYSRQNMESAGPDIPSFDEQPSSGPSAIESVQNFGTDGLTDPNFWMFFFINALILSAGIVLSVKVHDSNPEFEEAWKDHEFKLPGYEKQIAGLTNKINEASTLVETQIQQHRSLIDPALEAQVKAYEEALNLRNVLARYANGVASQVEDKAAVVVSVYRAGNMTNRTSIPPAEWNEPYSLEIPGIALMENNILKFFKTR